MVVYLDTLLGCLTPDIVKQLKDIDSTKCGMNSKDISWRLRLAGFFKLNMNMDQKLLLIIYVFTIIKKYINDTNSEMTL